MVSKKAQVSWRAADKIIHQYLSDSLTPSNVQTCEEFTPKGPGSKTLSIDDETCLLYLYFENPYRPLTSYVRELFNMTSTLANEKTLSKWFLKSLPHRMGIKKGTIAPIDKFTPENALRRLEFIDFMVKLEDHDRLVFVDEKKLKGCEIYNIYGRPNPFTGEMPQKLFILISVTPMVS